MKKVVRLSASGVQVGDKTWEWGQDVVRNQEISDKARWDKEAEEFWKKTKVKGRVKIVLDRSLIFDKEVGERADEAAFWAEVPIEPENMAKIVVKRGEKKWLVAANKKFYEAVIDSMKRVRVEGVYPEGEEKMSFVKIRSGWEWWPVAVGIVVAGAIVAGAWWWGLQSGTR